MIATLICWWKNHDYVRVRVDGGPFFLGAGPVMSYAEDPDGEYLACRRCHKAGPELGLVETKCFLTRDAGVPCCLTSPCCLMPDDLRRS